MIGALLTRQAPLAVAAVICFFAAPVDAEQRIWASVAFGPAAGVSPARFETEVFGLGVEADYDAPTQIKLVQAAGYQLLGTPLGPAVVVELQESFGSHHFLLQLVPRLAWSFALPVKLPIKQLQLDLTPSLGVGYIHFARQTNGGQSASGNGLSVQLAIEGRLIYLERYFVSLRPIEIAIQRLELTSGQVQAWGTFVRYNLLIGAGMWF